MPSQYEYMTQEEIHSFITQQLELHNQSLQVASTSTSSKWGYAIGAAVVVATGGYFALCRWKKQTRSVAREPKPVKVLKQKHVAVESEKCAAADVDRFASELKERRNERLMRAGALVSVSMVCAAARLSNWKW